LSWSPTFSHIQDPSPRTGFFGTQLFLQKPSAGRPCLGRPIAPAESLEWLLWTIVSINPLNCLPERHRILWLRDCSSFGQRPISNANSACVHAFFHYSKQMLDIFLGKLNVPFDFNGDNSLCVRVRRVHRQKNLVPAENRLSVQIPRLEIFGVIDEHNNMSLTLHTILPFTPQRQTRMDSIKLHNIILIN
jgi:hypothetical protein